MRAKIDSNHDAIVEPSLRPIDPATVSPRRFRLAVALFVLGIILLVAGAFVAFGQILFVAGSILIFAGWLLVGRLCRPSDKPHDIRKLYRTREV